MENNTKKREPSRLAAVAISDSEEISKQQVKRRKPRRNRKKKDGTATTTSAAAAAEPMVQQSDNTNHIKPNKKTKKETMDTVTSIGTTGLIIPSTAGKIGYNNVSMDETKNLSTSVSHLTDVEFASLQSISNESKRAIEQVLKYTYLTKVQHATLDSVVSGVDVIAKAKTGTGKTVAFLLPIIERIMSSKKASISNRSKEEKEQITPISGLILSPTRELAMQISKEAQALCTFQRTITIACFIGGTNIKQDIMKLRNRIDILVVTPGRLIDHLTNNNERICQRVTQLDTLVLDEADQLLDMGFKNDIDKILSFLPPVTKRQTLLYSATFTESVKAMAQRALKSDHLYIDTIEEGDQQTNTHVPQEHIVCNMDTVTSSLEAIVLNHMQSQTGYKILVFFNTARTAGFMAQLFQIAGYDALEMHSRKNQNYRVKVAKDFHDGTNIMMFSSDVSARGVDYPDVTLIVQVGMTVKEQYIHRLGRTGRAGRTGRGILLLCDFEKSFLKDLIDLDINPGTIPIVETVQLKSSALLQHLPKTLTVPGEQAYQAYLGYYNSNLRRIGMNKSQLVQLANHYSRTIGFQEPPVLQKKTVGKMGLKGTPGLRVA